MNDFQTIDLIANFLFTTGMVITILILLVLIRSKKKELPNRILIGIFIFLFSVPLAGYGELNNLRIVYAIGFLLSDPIGFFVGPFLLLYIKSLYQSNTDLIKKNWLHFLPAILYTLLITIPYVISILIRKHLFSYLKTFDHYDVLLQLQAFYVVVYCLIALHLLSRYQHTLKLNYSNLNQKDLSWVKYLLIGILSTISIHIVTVFYELAFGMLQWDISYITTFTMIFIILYLGYYGASQARILLPEYLMEELNTPPEKNKAATPSHHLANASEAEISALKKRIQETLVEERPYLDEELTLGALAELIPTTEKKLSAVLNHYLQISFYDLINNYRVEAVKVKMANPKLEHLTLLGLAYESGFKSKSSFNRIFKKTTGLSPSEYKKQLLVKH